MSAGRSKRKNYHRRGQSMMEFVIALPILLFVIFGIIEFARMTFAWLVVQNAARFGIRYAVTGEFNNDYCDEAGNYLSAAHVNADTHDGDPQDCKVPDSYTGSDANELERELIDHARLFSIRDAAIGGGAGLWLDPAVSGDYEQYLLNHDVTYLGKPSRVGFYHITVCSNRDARYSMDRNNYPISLCFDNVDNNLMDDAGGPGDRVKVHVEHRHPLLLPLLSRIWPTVSLNAERDGIVEKFRTSRVAGVSGPIMSAPTWTQTPTVTPTPTDTPTPTATSTATPTDTPTVTPSPIPLDCNLISIKDSVVGEWGWGYYGLMVDVRNDNQIPVALTRAKQDWTKDTPDREAAYFRFNGSPWEYIGDKNPSTNWTPGSPISLSKSSTGTYIALFTPRYDPLEGYIDVDLTFDNKCHVGVTRNVATSTPTPVPLCDRYEMSGFDFLNQGEVEMTITNGDIYDAEVERIRLNWDTAEAFGEANSFSNLHADWFKWNGADAWGWGDYGYGEGWGEDYSSITDTSVDSAWSWRGSLEFNAGQTYSLRIDFDGLAGGGQIPGVGSQDFGIIVDFDNGCQLERSPVDREVVTFTPTNTPIPTETPIPSNTPTPSDTPTPSPIPTNTSTSTITPTFTLTPTPDCSLYSLGNFSFHDYAMQTINLTNNDVVDAKVSRVDFDWDYAESYGEVNGYTDLNVDWIQWSGADIWGQGQGSKRDYASNTDTSVDHTSSWDGPVSFNAGKSYTLRFDFDDDWGGGGRLTGVKSSDFGINIYFENGCQLSKSAVSRPVYTWTPTSTPTSTPTQTHTPLPTNTPQPSNTPEPTDTPAVTNTFTPSPTPTSEDTPTPTLEPTWTPACPYDDTEYPCNPTWTPTPD